MTIARPDSHHRKRILALPNGEAGVWLEVAGNRVSCHTSYKLSYGSSGGGGGTWLRCSEIGCLGEAIEAGRCFRHSASPQRQAYIVNAAATATTVSLRGCEIDSSAFEDLAKSSVFAGPTIGVGLDITGADVDVAFDLPRRHWKGGLRVTAATFHHGLRVQESRFDRECDFSFADFRGGPGCMFNSMYHAEVRASFAHSDQQSIDFRGSTFEKDFLSEGVSGALVLQESVFNRRVDIRNGDFRGLSIAGSLFNGEFLAENSIASGLVGDQVRFPNVKKIGPIKVDQWCTLSGAQFGSRIVLELEASRLRLSSSRFEQGGLLRVRRAVVELDHVTSGLSLTVAGPNDAARQPDIYSLEGFHSTAALFSRVSMRRCIFQTVGSLETITLDPTVQLERYSVTSTNRGRQVVADEIAWRAHHAPWFARKWLIEGAATTTPVKRPHEVVVLPELQASQVALVYRTLRRGFEAQSDQPGAADFYYGEMEMRRYSKERGIAEQAIVWLYWMAAGYGLRASRAFGILAILLLSGAYSVNSRAQPNGVSFSEALLFSIQAAIPGIETASVIESQFASYVAVVLGVIGPILFGLGLLGLRGRVRR